MVVSAVTAVCNLQVREPTLLTGMNGQSLGFAIVGLLDAAYLLMLFTGAADLSYWSLCVQLQTAVFLLMGGRLIFTSQTFRLMHYLGGVCLLAAVIVDLQQSQNNGQGRAALFVFFSFFPYTVSQILKLTMLRSGAFCCFSFNKWTLFFTVFFSVGLLILIVLIDSPSQGRAQEISSCFRCLYGSEGCDFEPLWLLFFALSTLFYQGVVYFAGRKGDHSRLVAGLNVPISLLGFALAGSVLKEGSPQMYEIVGCM